MGVTGLWTVVQPCARPIKLETLNKKRLAVDASIWIYQFLKAVRDKEGNALPNSHVVGFFRRICKLLFFGIKPVFVFDGGAPILKRQTISARKSRREGRREDAVRTAGKLLALQMQRRAEEDDRKRRDERDRPTAEHEEEEVPDDLVYVDELQMTAQERQQNRQFKKKDAYHLPQLDVSLEEMGAPNDPRIMSHEELEEYARQFHTGEDFNVYDFSKIDFNSPFFLSLPASDRYNILNAARLRSRLRMGHSKEQLDTMFPDRMAFSRFQIQRVSERNELTQRLMNINGMNGEDAMFGVNGGGRVAGEKGREYVLVKNDGVEGGWALGVVSNKDEGERNKPIDVEGFGKENLTQEAEGDGSEEEGFEDVPIEGLNRLPKRSAAGVSGLEYSDGSHSMDIMERRRALYEARQAAAGIEIPEESSDVNAVTDEHDSLFVPQVLNGVVGQEDDEEINDLFEDVPLASPDENHDLSRAIAMSLEKPEEEEGYLADMPVTAASSEYKGPSIDRPLEFNQKNAKAGRDFAHQTNARAHGVAPKPFFEDSDGEDDLHLQASLEESRRTMHKSQGPQGPSLRALSPRSTSPLRTAPKQKTGFDGPLPFESINFGNSILGCKKTKVTEEEGGFEKQQSQKEKSPQPLPPWFSKDVLEANASQKTSEDKEINEGGPSSRAKIIENQHILKRQETGEVIDLDALVKEVNDVVDIASSSDEQGDVIIEEVIPLDSEIRMGDIADQIRAEPPMSGLADNDAQPLQDTAGQTRPETISAQSKQNSEEPIEWEESDPENDRAEHDIVPDAQQLVSGNLQPSPSKSPSPEFGDVGNLASPGRSHNDAASHKSSERTPLPQASSLDLPAEDSDAYSDPEDEDLMRQLAAEASEHARFASTLSSTSHLHSAQDYETELRQLRNQQKKDRRDADEVSHIMITECQQLLKLFGLPYITAPMEAEAQCAELVNLGLVDGIVTDDSDIFLFGGTRVYKNMFNQAKFVECYLSSDLEKEYSLDRHALIRIAHLLGSDYTEGLPSVGPVTALEILSEFSSLETFAEWWSAIQLNPKLSPEDAAIPFRRKFRKNASKLFLPTIFPDTRVDEAYLHPEVDKDTSPFQWGVPDLDALRQFLMATIGWSQERTDEVLVPVIKDMNRRENEGTQANITQFFGGGVGIGGRQNSAKGNTASGNAAGGGQFAPRCRVEGKSKRMESALGRLHAQARNRTLDEGEGEGEGEVSHDDAPRRTGDLGEAAVGDQHHSKGKKRPPPRETSASDSGDEDGEGVARKGRKRGRGAGRGKRGKA